MEQVDIQRCCKKSGDFKARCGKIATHKITLVSDNTKIQSTSFRCEKHKNTRTKGKRVVDFIELDQKEKAHECLKFLLSKVGQSVQSSIYSNVIKIVFVKHDLLTVMGKDIKGKWKMLYPNQIR